ncbi:hypothetical protein GOV11_02530 [Candidatus Woesearchaeota archaeon]|nr:hypothetical protein [Candidatus Woesearchaeota archaeon]
MEKLEHDIDKVLTDRPFSSKMEIGDLKPISADNAISCEAFFVKTKDGQEFKLRDCGTVERAKMIEKIVRKVPKYFPKFLGRDGEYVLFEKLKSFRDITNEELRANTRQLGRLCAEINNIESEGQNRHIHFFEKQITDLLDRSEIDKKSHDKAKRLHKHLLSKIDVQLALEVFDLHGGNIMINDKSKLIFVDDGGIEHRVKGMGFAKLCSVIDEKAEKEFVEGYKEIEDGSHLTGDYMKFVHLIEVVRSLAFKTRRGTAPHIVPSERDRFYKLIE